MEVVKTLTENGINGKNISKNKVKLKNILSEYFKKNNISKQKNKDLILKSVVEKLIRS